MPDVLVCGAGPTGLVLALRLARSGVRVRIVDAAAAPAESSRALVVHARTLELYRQMGWADPFLAEGLKFVAVNLWRRGRHLARVPLGDLGKGLSPFPFMMVCSQDRHERFLIDRLEEAGVQVDRPAKLIGLEQERDRVRVRLQRSDEQVEVCEASYLAGCDGAHSTVRGALGEDFPGGTYSRVFYVADVEATGPVMNDELHLALDDADLLGIFPLRGRRTARLIGTVEAAHESSREALRYEDVGHHAAARIGIAIERVNWFSTYRVHHRVAREFRRGRVFLLGDAAHVHSPVGGQGMNTGIGDAVNLAWKLADVVKGRAKPDLLDSYEPERIAFAQRLVATTDRAFVLVSSEGRLARFVRTRIAPVVLPVLFRSNAIRKYMFRTVSQIAITYRGSPVSTGQAGSLHGGDRLPWFDDNFDVLDGIRWQVHVYGSPAHGLAAACETLALPLHAFAWKPAMRKAGFERDALYLIRPDGHIALAEPRAAAAALKRYADRVFTGSAARP
jgi:2-polyprenyl-6-methoxyphenol hydroxylase-like FAD-dependent oxidoreductase